MCQPIHATLLMSLYSFGKKIQTPLGIGVTGLARILWYGLL
ncbi:MAG: hypothetical protein PUP46_00060 [Endozoicomonas sp. (ex Botrylloides leachii)]|nr:hypothetical protein [Endozoicomonas sp. (ex Botrylloides leachii)]